MKSHGSCGSNGQGVLGRCGQVVVLEMGDSHFCSSLKYL